MNWKSTPLNRRLVAIAAAGGMTLAVAIPAVQAADRNDDRIPDRWERKHGLSLKVNQARRDQDRDGLRNRGEFRSRMNPRDADTDDDGTPDGDEGAGVVNSFNPESGRLVIDLFAGEAVTGFVVEETEIECDDDDLTDPDGTDEDGDGVDDDAESGESEDGESGESESGESGESESGEGESGESGESEGYERSGTSSGPGHAGEDDGDGAACSAADLVPGAVVREADLDLSARGLIFEEIELRRP